MNECAPPEREWSDVSATRRNRASSEARAARLRRRSRPFSPATRASTLLLLLCPCPRSSALPPNSPPLRRLRPLLACSPYPQTPSLAPAVRVKPGDTHIKPAPTTSATAALIVAPVLPAASFFYFLAFPPHRRFSERGCACAPAPPEEQLLRRSPLCGVTAEGARGPPRASRCAACCPAGRPFSGPPRAHAAHPFRRRGELLYQYL